MDKSGLKLRNNDKNPDNDTALWRYVKYATFTDQQF
jgi:hypothetical protein